MNMFLLPKTDSSEFKRRYKWMALFFALGFALVVIRLFYLQVLSGDEYTFIAKENIVRKIKLSTTRGVIRDSYGKILASSRPGYNAYLVPGRVMPSLQPKTSKYRKRKKTAPDSFLAASHTLRLNPEETRKLIEKFRAICVDDVDAWDDDHSACWKPVLVREDLPRDIVVEVKQHASELVGVDISQRPVRYFPYKNLGAHMLGYVSEIDKETLSKYRPDHYDSLSSEEKMKMNPLGYSAGDAIGSTGVERAWESQLRGQRGWEKRVVDATGTYRKGPEAERLIDPPKRLEPIPGRDVRLTVDIELMAAIQKAMLPHLSGAVVVIDVHTGRILALYSKPDFDPSDLSGSGGREKRRETINKLFADPLNPLLDKTMTGAFQPGSTFKPFSAMAALESHLIDPKENVRCEGFLTFGRRRFRCTHVHGLVNMHDAVAESCNVYFYKLAEVVGVDRIAAVASEFGLGQKTGIGINPESPGKIPTRAWYSLRYRGQYRVGLSLYTAIGQAATNVTPLQLALAYGAIANGGTVYMPQLVSSLETPDGAITQKFGPRVKQKVDVSPENIARVSAALWSVVNEPKGTAYAVRDPSLDVSGKTGTAQTGYVSGPSDDPKKAWYYGRDHAWFAAFAPSHDPQIAVSVLVEHGGAGPTQAAPVAMAVVREYTRLMNERKQKSEDSSKRAP